MISCDLGIYGRKRDRIYRSTLLVVLLLSNCEIWLAENFEKLSQKSLKPMHAINLKSVVSMTSSKGSRLTKMKNLMYNLHMKNIVWNWIDFLTYFFTKAFPKIYCLTIFFLKIIKRPSFLLWKMKYVLVHFAANDRYKKTIWVAWVIELLWKMAIWLLSRRQNLFALSKYIFPIEMH